MGSDSYTNQVAMLLALGNMVFCGRAFYASAVKQLRHGAANMDTLVALSTSIAFVFSVFNTFWGEAVWGARGMQWHHLCSHGAYAGRESQR